MSREILQIIKFVVGCWLLVVGCGWFLKYYLGQLLRAD